MGLGFRGLGFFPSYPARTKPALQGNSEATEERAVGFRGLGFLT